MSKTLSLDEARAHAAAFRTYPLVREGVRESERWWFIPVRQIGSFGIVVNKMTGECTELGSCSTLDDWLWGYDAGLLGGPVDFVVTEIFDLGRSVEILASIGFAGGDRWWTRKALETLPARFDAEWLWMVFPEVRALDMSAFRWKIVPRAA